MRFLLSFLFILITASGFSQTISGKITDSEGNPLPYANVLIKGSGAGTTTNGNGDFKILLKESKGVLIFKYIGFQTKEVAFDLRGKDSESIVVKLLDQGLSLKEFQVNADKEDPAYGIIRKAIKAREKNGKSLDAFSCLVYTKSVQKIKKFPKKIMGFKLDRNNMGIIDTVSGIIYLSEAVSNYHFQQPNLSKEEMLSSKVSGSNRSFSFNRAFDQYVNFYEGLVKLQGLSDRGFVSPIGAQSLLHYDFKLEGDFNENGVVIDKIKVTAKGRNTPAFNGYIWIEEGHYAIHSLDLQIVKDNGLKFIDSLRIRQNYFPLKKDKWVRLNSKFDFGFNLFGVKGGGEYLCSYQNYELKNGFPKGFFTNEVALIKDSANLKDINYWDKIRPVPLTKEESVDYVKRDSVTKVKESKPYLDSMDKVQNKWKWSNILRGYNHSNSFKKTFWSVTPLQGLQFNPVEGLVLNGEANFNKSFENRNRMVLTPSLRYGTSSKTLYSRIRFNYFYDRKSFSFFEFQAGHGIAPLNDGYQPAAIFNSLYALFDKQNFYKMIVKDGFSIRWGTEILNGLVLRLSQKMEWRKALNNSTDFSFLKKDQPYAPNLLPDQQSLANLEQIGIGLRYTPGQKYITRPDAKVRLGSKWPTFEVNLEKAIPFADFSSNFLNLEGSVRYDYTIGLLGNGNWMIKGGSFLDKTNVTPADYFYFRGNQTFLGNQTLDQFAALPYYQGAGVNTYAQFHIEHRFGGFFLNKIPLLKRLQITEHVQLHTLVFENGKPYQEVVFGFQRGILPFRFSVYLAGDSFKFYRSGFLLALPFSF